MKKIKKNNRPLAEKMNSIIPSILVVFAVISVLFLLFLRVAFPPEKIKNMIETYTKTEFNREIIFDNVSFRIAGVELKNFAVSEKEGFGNGTFAKAERIVFKVRLLPLLRKQFYVSSVEGDGVELNIIKEKGRYNFSGLLRGGDGEEKHSGGNEKENKKPVYAISDIRIKKSKIMYDDRDNRVTYTVTNLSCEADKLKLNKEFPVKLQAGFNFKSENKNISLPVDLLMGIDLAGRDYAKMNAEIKYLNTKFNSTNFRISAKARNAFYPDINLAVSADVLTDETFKDFLKLDLFKMNKVDAKANVKINLLGKIVEIKKADIGAGKSNFSIKGNLDYGKENIDYSLSAALNIDMKEMSSFYSSGASNYSLEGTVDGYANINNDEITVIAQTNGAALSFKEPDIRINDINAKTVINALLKSKRVEIRNLDVYFMDSSASMSGDYSYGLKTSYAFDITGDIDLSNAAKVFAAYLDKYDAIAGNAATRMKWGDSEFKGSVELSSASVTYASVFGFEKLRGKISFNSIYDISLSSAAGLLNGESFALSASYFKELQKISASLDLTAGKLYFPEFLKDADISGNVLNSGTENDASAGDGIRDEIPYLVDFKTNISAGLVEMPDISVKDFKVNADLKNISNDLRLLSGTIRFSAGKTAIVDLKELTNANQMTKVLFYILGVTYKTSKDLGVSVFDEEKKYVNGIKFREAQGYGVINKGNMDLHKLKVTSGHASITLAGNLDIKTQELNMRLTVNPLLAKSIVMKIGGTLTNPKESLDVAASAFTILDTIKNTGMDIYDSLKPEK